MSSRSCLVTVLTEPSSLYVPHQAAIARSPHFASQGDGSATSRSQLSKSGGEQGRAQLEPGGRGTGRFGQAGRAGTAAAGSADGRAGGCLTGRQPPDLQDSVATSKAIDLKMQQARCQTGAVPAHNRLCSGYSFPHLPLAPEAQRLWLLSAPSYTCNLSMHVTSSRRTSPRPCHRLRGQRRPEQQQPSAEQAPRQLWQQPTSCGRKPRTASRQPARAWMGLWLACTLPAPACKQH